MLVEHLQPDVIGKDHKNAYTNRVLNVFKPMLAKAVEWELVEEDVLRHVRQVKMLQENSRCPGQCLHFCPYFTGTSRFTDCGEIESPETPVKYGRRGGC